MDLLLYVEIISTSKTECIELNYALEASAPGDRFVFYKLDRLKELYQLTDEMAKRQVDFVSIQDSFDTTTPTGRTMFGMLAVFAEFERDIIQQRTKAGLEAARKRGCIGGRPAIDTDTKHRIVKLIDSGESAIDIAKEEGTDYSRQNVSLIIYFLPLCNKGFNISHLLDD